MFEFCYYFLDFEQRELYLTLRNCLMRYEKIVPINKMSVDSVNAVIKAVLTDTPECFFFEGKWRILQKEDNRYIFLCYTVNIAELKQMQRQLDFSVNNICKKILNETSNFDKIKYENKWFLNKDEYGVIGGRGQTAYEALVCKKAVCKGISKGMQLILRKLGIFSTLQLGTIDGANKHAWNIVEIDDSYYHLDICMGFDCSSFLFESAKRFDDFRCFLVSKEQISKTHTLSDTPSSYL